MKNRKKWKSNRKQFRKDLEIAMSNNHALAMLAIETYSAYQHRRHIMKIWEFLGFNHREAYRDYCDKLFGSHLTGENRIMKSLYFADREIYDKYRKIIPERAAMGDALGVAYKTLKKASIDT